MAEAHAKADARASVEALLVPAAAGDTYRVVVRHTDPKHPNRAWAHWRQNWQNRDHADAALELAKDEYPASEYEHKVQVLEVDGDSAKWKDVN